MAFRFECHLFQEVVSVSEPGMFGSAIESESNSLSRFVVLFSIFLVLQAHNDATVTICMVRYRADLFSPACTHETEMWTSKIACND